MVLLIIDLIKLPPPSPYKSYLTLCKRRTRQLLIPYLLWSVIKWAIGGSFYLDRLINTFVAGGFFWFLWALWVISIIFIMGNMLSRILSIRQEIMDGVITVSIILVMVLGDIRILGFQFISYYFVFYIIGYYCNKYNKLLITNNIWFVIFCGVVWLSMASFWNMHKLPFFLEEIPYIPKSLLLYAYRFVTALVGLFALLNVGHRFLNGMKSFNTHIVHIGKVSLGLYVIHLVIIISLSKWLVAVLPSCPLSMLIGISFTLTCCLAISIVEILSRCKITAKLLLGKV